ncbi:MAG: hypothetical protein AAGU05_11235, partial [Anaerolineaceae bacterium]
MKKIAFLAVFCLCLSVLTACSMPFRAVTAVPATQPPLQTAETGQTSVPQAHEPEITAEPQPTAPADTDPTDTDPAAVCPQAAQGNSLYIDEANGFCLLVPDDFTQKAFQEYQYDRVEFARPSSGAVAPEHLDPALVIEINGNAGEQNGLQYARRWKENFAAGQTAEPREMSVNGRQGASLVYETLFGPMSQAAFVTANDVKYRLVLSPALGTAPD